MGYRAEVPYHCWYGMGSQWDVPWDGISLGCPMGRYISGTSQWDTLFFSGVTILIGTKAKLSEVCAALLSCAPRASRLRIKHDQALVRARVKLRKSRIAWQRPQMAANLLDRISIIQYHTYI